MPHVKTPVQLAQAVVNYLITKPYAEVHDLLAELRNLPVEQEAPKTEPAPPAPQPEPVVNPAS
jgi:hypothetical protein